MSTRPLPKPKRHALTEGARTPELPQFFRIRVMIASPSDMKATRAAIFSQIESFNRTQSEIYGFFLQQHSWEYSVASSGRYAQAELNAQLVSSANVLVAMFKNKFGSPTEKYDSGTQEEIEEFFKLGGEPAVYFRDDLSSIPADDQIELLRDYQSKLFGEPFLVGSYTAASDGQIDHDVVVKALESIRDQANKIVQASSKSSVQKKNIKDSLDRLPKSKRSDSISVSKSTLPSAASFEKPLPQGHDGEPATKRLKSVVENASYPALPKDDSWHSSNVYTIHTPVDRDEYKRIEVDTRFSFKMNGSRNSWLVLNNLDSSVVINYLSVNLLMRVDGKSPRLTPVVDVDYVRENLAAGGIVEIPIPDMDIDYNRAKTAMLSICYENNRQYLMEYHFVPGD